MMKKLILLLLIMPFYCLAQKNKEKLVLPTKDSSIHYEKIDTFKSQAKDLFFNKVIEWCANRYRNSNDVIKLQDRTNGTVVGVGSFVVSTGGILGTNWRVRYTFRIDIKDHKYRIQVNNFLRDLIADRITPENYTNVDKLYFNLYNPDNYTTKPDIKFFTALDKETKETILSLEQFVNKSDDF